MRCCSEALGWQRLHVYLAPFRRTALTPALRFLFCIEINNACIETVLLLFIIHQVPRAPSVLVKTGLSVQKPFYLVSFSSEDLGYLDHSEA